MAIRDEFLARYAQAIRFGNLDLAPPAWKLASRLLPNSSLKGNGVSRLTLLVSYNLCSVWVVRAATGNQGCHSYSPVAHRPRNTRPEKAGSFLSVILRQTIIGGHGNGCQLHPKLADPCRFGATLNRYRSG